MPYGNYNNMTELSRHIEILLLDNDCVIVPGFGGFMAHHRPAEFSEELRAFYPPQRTLGFNPQLQLNDSLIAQSYVEAYDISYPEAVRLIENEVEEVKQALAINGNYEFHGIGTITLTADSKYIFEPCTAGLLTPSLYALNTFQFNTLDKAIEQDAICVTIAQDVPVQQDAETLNEEEIEEEEVEIKNFLYSDNAISISIPLLKKIAAAAILLCFIFFNSIPAGRGSGKVTTCSIIDTELITSIVTPKANVATASVAALQVEPTPDEKKLEEEVDEEEARYTIVLASKIGRKGANEFVESLKKKGLQNVRIEDKRNIRRVLCGKFKDKKEAIEALHNIRSSFSKMSEAWIAEI